MVNAWWAAGCRLWRYPRLNQWWVGVLTAGREGGQYTAAAAALLLYSAVGSQPPHRVGFL